MFRMHMGPHAAGEVSIRGCFILQVFSMNRSNHSSPASNFFMRFYKDVYGTKGVTPAASCDLQMIPVKTPI